jgi:hypothetical protein
LSWRRSMAVLTPPPLQRARQRPACRQQFQQGNSYTAHYPSVSQGFASCNGGRLDRSQALGAEMYPAAAELADTDPNESVARACPTRTSQP